MLNVNRKQASDITEKDIMLAQYNNLFTKGNAAAQTFSKRGTEGYKSASRVAANPRPNSNAGVTYK